MQYVTLSVRSLRVTCIAEGRFAPVARGMGEEVVRVAGVCLTCAS